MDFVDPAVPVPHLADVPSDDGGPPGRGRQCAPVKTRLRVPTAPGGSIHIRSASRRWPPRTGASKATVAPRLHVQQVAGHLPRRARPTSEGEVRLLSTGRSRSRVPEAPSTASIPVPSPTLRLVRCARPGIEWGLLGHEAARYRVARPH